MTEHLKNLATGVALMALALGVLAAFVHWFVVVIVLVSSALLLIATYMLGKSWREERRIKRYR